MKNLHDARIVFFGTPAFSVPSLESLFRAGSNILCVTMPDRPVGRSRSLQPSAVKQFALASRIPLLQPEKLDRQFLDAVRDFHPVVGVVAAYGKIFKPDLLSLPSYGIVNVHPSLLPRHRGASPIQSTILSGDRETGVTLIVCDEGCDTGPVLARVRHPLTGTESAGDLSTALSRLGAEIIVKTILRYCSGELSPTPQPTHGATVTRRLTKEAGQLDARFSADELERCIRAYSPWPCAWVTINGMRLKILAGQPERDEAPEREGTIIRLSQQRALAICAGGGTVLRLVRVQPEGKRELSEQDFFHGYQSLIGTRVTPLTNAASPLPKIPDSAPA
jgi:methionyl-tRNA formyltransferase